jgi:hypothetical protein
MKSALSLPLLIRSYYWPLQEANMSTKFVEVIGVVKDDLSVKMVASMNMGDDLGECPRPALAFKSAIKRWKAIEDMLTTINTESPRPKHRRQGRPVCEQLKRPRCSAIAGHRANFFEELEAAIRHAVPGVVV